MNVKIIHPNNFKLELNFAETQKQGKEIYEFTNFTVDPYHIMIDGVAYYPDRHYLSDLSSIPKPLTVIKGFERYRWRHASLIHDQLYRLKYLYRRDGVKVLFDREEADKIYKLLIIEEGKLTNTTLLANIVAPIQWLGLRLGGWWSYER